MRCVSCDAELTTAARFCATCGAPAPAPQADSSDALRVALEKALGFQYRVERLLGRGGMGAVYLARELALDRDVAIKVLPPDSDAGEERRARFRREARTAAKLTHPHIVPLLTFGEVNGLAYYVMGYVRGESLAARMRGAGKMPTEITARLLAEIADALDYAHAQGVVHRDIKPDNILLDADSGRALLTDFGIARAAGAQNLTSTGMVVGTPRYMSPEQAAGLADLDGRSDLYSLGLIGYEMLTGAAPFEGRTPAELLLQRMTREPTPLATRAREAPVWLTTAISKCLLREPSARWRDAGLLRKQLLSGGAESDQPVALANLASATQALVLAWLFALGFCFWGRATGTPDLIWHSEHLFDLAPGGYALLFATALVALMAVHARKRGHAWSALRVAVLRQPRWWPAWYPAAGRAPGDVWTRLPHHVRWVRAFAASFFLMCPLAILFGTIDQTELEVYQRTGSYRGFWNDLGGEKVSIGFGHALSPYLLAGFGFAIWSFRRLRGEAHRSFTDEEDIWVVYVRPTGDTRFWAKPVYAALLAPAAERPRPSEEPAPTQDTGGPPDVTRTRG